MAMLDLVKKMRELSERGWDWNDVLFLLEDVYIEVQEEEIDKVKCAVVEFLKACVRCNDYNDYVEGYTYLCDVMTIMIKEKKSYSEAVNDTAAKYIGLSMSSICENMRRTISQMAFDDDMPCFEEINFWEGNYYLDEEFVNEAVEYLESRIK